MKFQGIILKKYQVKYYECKECGYLFTEEPYWLEEAYDSSILKSDIGYTSRNINYTQRLLPILSKLKIKKSKCLDYGGGYGLFTRLMRDSGYDFYCYDKYTNNIFSEAFNDIKLKTKYKLITCFEVFEHLPNPVEELEKLLEIGKIIIFTTELLTKNYETLDEWWYFNPREGQHISFYTIESLKRLGLRYEMNFYTDGKSLHIFTSKIFKENILNDKLGVKFFKEVYNKIILKKRKSLLNNDYLTLIKNMEGTIKELD